MRDREILREYVRSVLLREFVEDEFGVGFGSGEMYDTFVRPFVDVFGVAAGELKKTGRRALTAARIGVEALVSGVIPILSADFGDIWRKHEQEIDQIESEYRAYYDSVWKAFDHEDVVAAAFVYSPLALFVNPLVKRAPGAFVRTVEKLAPDDKSVSSFIDKVSSQYSVAGIFGEAALREEGGSPKRPIEDVLTQPKLLAALARSPAVKQISAAGRQAVDAQLASAVKRATAVASARDVAAIEKLTGKKFARVTQQLGKLSGAERSSAEAAVLKQLKAAAKKLYAAPIEKRIEQATSAGVPSSSPYVKAHKRALERLRAL